MANPAATPTACDVQNGRPASNDVRLAALFLALLMFAGTTPAADLHLSPTGEGSRDGSDWKNALAASSLANAINEKMKPGDRLLIAGGAYTGVSLTLSKGGNAGQSKTIVGIDNGEGPPVFSGTWSVDQPTKGTTAIRIGPGVSHVVLENLRMRGYVTGIQAGEDKGGAARTNLVFKDVDIEQCRHGFYLSDCDDLQLINCDLKRYTKHAFRFEQGCDRVKVRGCSADCSEGDAEWEKKTELFPFGFMVNDGGAPNSAFVFEDCLSRNNLMPLQKTKYKNGDGYVVEGNTTDVTFVRCRAIRNQDGGFDLKVPGVQLTDCVSVGNSRGYRIWTTGTLLNCFVGWGSTGLWSNGGPITASRCTFHELRNTAVTTDDRATQPVTLIDCLISATAKPSAKTAGGDVKINTSIIADPAVPKADPKYVRSDPAWDGLGDAMNSGTYADKGYRAVAAKAGAKAK